MAPSFIGCECTLMATPGLFSGMARFTEKILYATFMHSMADFVDNVGR
jgi:hypothetical protein